MDIENQKKSLVLVLGAGASKEVNLPDGAELRTRIANALDLKIKYGSQKKSGDEAIIAAYQILARDEYVNINIGPYLAVSTRICEAMPLAISIDNFIDSHRNDDLIAICGKLAIAHCILRAEWESKLFNNKSNDDDRFDFGSVAGTWFNSFFQLITENCHVTELDKRLAQIAIVSFNYDRCIKHYLHGALQNYYGITSVEAAEAMSHLQVYHPYGSVGQLPWESRIDSVDFGGNAEGRLLIKISKGIRTFTEGIDPEHSRIVDIRNTLEKAQKVVFLGFAFHRLNLQLLFPGLSDGQEIINRSTYATGYGISDSDCQEIKNELHSLGAVNYQKFYLRNDLTCYKLFGEYWRSLSLNL